MNENETLKLSEEMLTTLVGFTRKRYKTDSAVRKMLNRTAHVQFIDNQLFGESGDIVRAAKELGVSMVAYNRKVILPQVVARYKEVFIKKKVAV